MTLSILKNITMHSRSPKKLRRTQSPTRNFLSAGFTLIELMVVIGIIVLMVAIMIPAIKSLTKSNDTSQATNLVRSMISTARSIAVSQHRRAGVVFFEETAQYSGAAHTGQTAMQLVIEDFYIDQNLVDRSGTITTFTDYSTTREYLPVGVKVATLSGIPATSSPPALGNPPASFNLAENGQTRAILFDANGQLLLRSGLNCLGNFPPPVGGNPIPGTYPYAERDWNFSMMVGTTPQQMQQEINNGTAPVSSPGFLLYNKTDFDAAGLNLDAQRASWLLQHSDVVLVNSNTGTVVVQQ